MHSNNRRTRGTQAAFTLLEIILALAILAGCLAVLGEVIRLGVQSADESRALARAHLLAASKLAEITSGAIPPDPATSVPFETDPLQEWTYSIAVSPTSDLNLLAVRVTVTRDVRSGHPPLEYSLLRWVADPSIQASTSTENQQGDQATETSQGN